MSFKYPRIYIFRALPGDIKLRSEDIPDATQGLIARYGFKISKIWAAGWVKTVTILQNCRICSLGVQEIDLTGYGMG